MVATLPRIIRIPDQPRQDAPRAGLFLSLLRDFQLTCDGVPVHLPMSGQRVLAYLALREGPMTRTGLAGTLWPETTEHRAMASLRSALWRVNRPGLRLVEATATHATLTDAMTVDVRRLTRSVVAALSRPGTVDRSTLAEVSGAEELLPGWYDDWVLFERERLRQLRLHALESLCVQLTDEGEYAAAIDVGLGAVAADPLRETARRSLIRAFLAEGNQAEAIGQYLSYRRLLKVELDVAPSAQIEAMIRGLRH
jgi:DNA-binding SARP family transcriptional activator